MEVKSTTREYVRPMPATWWMHNRYLQIFMLRELSSFFVAAYAIFLLVVLYHVGRGGEDWNAFYTNVLRSPVAIVLELIALAMVLFHSITTFNAAPTIIVVWRGDEKVSPSLISGSQYAMWAVGTAVVLLVAFLWS